MGPSGNVDVMGLAERYAAGHKLDAEAIAQWLAWCLPRGVDPTAPTPSQIAQYGLLTRRDVAWIRHWRQWCRARAGIRPQVGPARAAAPPPVVRTPVVQDTKARQPTTVTAQVRRVQPDTTALSADQTRRLLRTAAEKFSGSAGTVMLLLFALDVRVRTADVPWLDLSDVTKIADDPAEGLRLRLPSGPVLDLPAVVCEQVAAHLTRFRKAQQVEAVDGNVRVPLLRTVRGRRVSMPGLYAEIKHIAAAADDDLRSLRAVTPAGLAQIDLRGLAAMPAELIGPRHDQPA
ncbi:hypothetical protein AB0B31_10760 [Catellatospora citrea]|uniref:hypothetical protein n=1 Tax=Catellatospora citrea TaxID=53366 RepID=UPI0034007030